MASHDARRLWQAIEPFHALTYFATETRDAFADVGVTGFWRVYFAARSAPLGVVPSQVATGAFYGFAPAFVARALPGVWQLCTPAAALAARLDGIDRAVRAHLAIDEVGAVAEQVVPVMKSLAGAAPMGGRQMFAANVALDEPTEPHLALWHWATVLREHRGDGHIAALVAADIDPVESHLLRLATSGVDPDSVLPHRGWSEGEQAAARRRLRDRGWLDADGTATTAGRDAHEAVESATDLAAGHSRADVDAEAVAEVVEHMLPLALAVADSIVPYPNAMGVPRPGT